MSGPINCYEFRHSADGEHMVTYDQIKNVLKGFAKSWAFQLEKSDDGYLHWQGNLSLIKKRRKTELLDILPIKFMHLAPLHDVKTLYMLKEDTRVEGPWTDKDVEVFVPYHLMFTYEQLYPWQQTVHRSSDIDQRNSRLIDLVYNPPGCEGKSTICGFMRLRNLCIKLPPLNDAKDIIQAACDMCESRELRDPKVVFIDLPRAMDKTRLYGIYSAIEQIKDGFLYDVRYHYKEWVIHSPRIWVFTNILPDINLLSKDRWNIWTINSDKCLEKFSFE